MASIAAPMLFSGGVPPLFAEDCEDFSIAVPHVVDDDGVAGNALRGLLEGLKVNKHVVAQVEDLKKLYIFLNGHPNNTQL